MNRVIKPPLSYGKASRCFCDLCRGSSKLIAIIHQSRQMRLHIEQKTMLTLKWSWKLISLIVMLRDTCSYRLSVCCFLFMFRILLSVQYRLPLPVTYKAGCFHCFECKDYDVCAGCAYLLKNSQKR